MDEQNQTSITLSNLFRSYKTQDPPMKREKAVPLSLLAHLLKTLESPLDRLAVSLMISALFFCLRSCEYLHTPGGSSKKTKILLLGGIRF
jgi:hypothetical protein